MAREYLSALERDGRLPDDWRFLYPAPATQPDGRPLGIMAQVKA